MVSNKPEGLSEIAIYQVSSYFREDYEYAQLCESIIFPSHHEAVKYIDKKAEKHGMKIDKDHLDKNTVKAYSKYNKGIEHYIKLELKFMYS
jgi:hypothetical protein